MRYLLLLCWGDCRIRYKGCLEKAVFTLKLLYNFHGMSFLVSNSLYQFLMDGLLGLWTSGSKVLMDIHPCRCILTAVLSDKIQWKQKEIDDRVKASEKNGPTLREALANAVNTLYSFLGSSVVMTFDEYVKAMKEMLRKSNEEADASIK